MTSPYAPIIKAAAGVAALFALLLAGSCVISRMGAKKGDAVVAQAQEHRVKSDVLHDQALESKARADQAGQEVEKLDRKRLELAPQVEAVKVQTPPVVLEQLEVQTQEIEALDLQVVRYGEAYRSMSGAWEEERKRSEALEAAVKAVKDQAAADKFKSRLVIGGVSVGAAGLVYFAWRRR